MSLDDPPSTVLPGRPEAARLHARVALAQLRRRMFGRGRELRFGRYRVVGQLGRGAQGQVFEAQDEELKRRVALKVIEATGPADRRGPQLRRLLREARAMAQVQHPNVVTIFAAGQTEDVVWIAMELVEGTTLLEWVADHPVGSPGRFAKARELLRQAGAGLAAAHRRAVVHRDFKPANVLVGADGVAKVADFGIALPPPTDPEPAVDESAHPLHTARRGPGTPRYMSPEQRRGAPVGAASDQFNFAVTAWEIVFGAPPFRGRDDDAMLQAAARGPGAPTDDRGVPTEYARALRRALAVHPHDRFPTMEALLGALAPRRRRRWLLPAVLAASAIGWGLSMLSAGAEPDKPRCSPETAEALIVPVTGPRRLGAVRDGLHGSGLPGAGAVVRDLEGDLADYAERWVGARTLACEARWHHRRIDELELDARMSCLRDCLDAVDALTLRLSTADLAIATRAVSAARSLPRPEDCAAARWRERNDDPAARKLRRRLATAEAERVGGRYEKAVQMALEVSDEARGRVLEVTTGDALEVAALAWAELADDRAFEAFAESHAIAVTHDESESAARRATAAARLYAYRDDLSSAKRWLRHADVALARAGASPAQLRATTHVRGLLHMKRAEYDDAARVFEEIRAATEDPTRDEIGWLSRADLIDIYAVTRPEYARQFARELFTEIERALGPSHPWLARLALDLAVIERRLGNPVGQVTHARRAVDVSLDAYGADSFRTAFALVRLGVARHDQGELDRAAEAYRGALRATGEREDAWTVRALRGLGRVHVEQGRPEEGERTLARAVAIAREIWATDRAELTTLRRTLAEVRIELGELERARSQLLRLRPVVASGPLSRRLEVELALAVLAEEEGSPAQAQVTYDGIAGACTDPEDVRANAICALAAGWSQLLRPAVGPVVDPDEATASDDPVLASTELLQRARRLWARGQHPDARATIRRALAVVGPGPGFTRRQQRRRIQRWIAAHGGAPEQPPGAR